MFEVVFGKDLALKYHDLFNLDKGKFMIDYGEINHEIINEENNDNDNLENNNEEENEEKIKIKKEFSHNIGNDFKNIYISYLNQMIK